MLEVFKASPEYNRLYELLTGAQGPASAFGVPEALRPVLAAALAQSRTVLFVTATQKGAEAAYAQASALCDNAALLPLRELPLVNAYAVSGEIANLRMDALLRLVLKKTTLLFTSAEAAMQRLCPPEVLQNAVHSIAVGDTIDPRTLLRGLTEAGYERVELVEGAGMVAARGDIVDVFPPHSPVPYRIEFFGDDVDRITCYDPVTQRSIENMESVLLSPATEAPQTPAAIERALLAIRAAAGFDAQRLAWEDGRFCPGAETLLPLLYPEECTVYEHLPEDALILLEEPHRIEEEAASAERMFIESVKTTLERGEGVSAQYGLLSSVNAFFSRMQTPRTGLLFTLSRSFARIRPKDSVQTDARPAPRYAGGIEELCQDVNAWKAGKNAVLLYAGAHTQRLRQQLQDFDCIAAEAAELTRAPAAGEALLLPESLPAGFVWPSIRLCVLGEAELLGKSGRKLKRGKKPQLAFSDLAVGDLIVHEAHGIGKFVGVETLTVQDNTRDYLLLQYAGGDKLYIPTDQLDRIQKYIGGGDGGEVPKLNRLGGSEWNRQVGRAKAAVKALAFDLAALYAKRSSETGFAFSQDTAWQRQLEEQFPYEETPDQLQCIEEIKKDMESPKAMDRLLCGDVGYGKTEVALRAAFKAVQDGKQVAFLVPTTILAQQHYNTLSARFADFPIRIGLLCRFKSAAEQKQTKEGLLNGQVEIVVGTHALLAKDVKFKDLGLLIVDEEQRFGVGHKEQIKNMRSSVDVLTLSATPIPRTLHMSMTGIRDMSTIETPPEDRYPVMTYVLEYTDNLLCDAIKKELSRGGQCYVVSNNVARMDRFAEHLESLLPNVHIICAHGQMPERQLENAMLDFMEGRFDVLVCSTIIENGLDISNVNTLFVMDADKMGLSQLYQLRGRVGRSTRLGYAYFTFQKDKILTEIAQKRLMTLSEFTQFGAGFQIAMRDLEIRGAGSLLGAEQSGHIADVGYEYYCKLMQSAISEAKGEAQPLTVETVLDIPLDAHIPKDYIASEVQRLGMYRRIAMITDRASLYDVQEEMEDRYGNIPQPVQNLMDAALVKALAGKAQAMQLTVREGSAKLQFHEQAEIDGIRLVAAAANTGAQIIQGDTVSLAWRLGNKSPGEILAVLPALLSEIATCAEAGE